jgi:hypothetical protein
MYIFNVLGEFFMKKAINREKMLENWKKNHKGDAKLSKTQERKDKKLLQRLRRQMRAERAANAVIYDGWIDRMHEEQELMKRLDEDE